MRIMGINSRAENADQILLPINFYVLLNVSTALKLARKSLAVFLRASEVKYFVAALAMCY